MSHLTSLNLSFLSHKIGHECLSQRDALRIKQDNVCRKLSIIPGKQGNIQEMLVIMMFSSTVLVT